MSYTMFFIFISEAPLPPTFAGFLANATVKVAAISLKLEIKLHAHQLGMNTQSNNEVTFTLV